MSSDKPELPNNAAAADTPANAARTRRFKIRLRQPGKTLPGEWLCRRTNAALAYQNYCGVHGTPRIFTWYQHRDGKSYLQDQEGHWLSYEAWDQCLYMSYWTNAVAWKIVDGRLVRESDGAVVTYRHKQHYPLASEHFLQALAPGDEAVVVEVVDEELSPMEKLLDKMVPVYEKRHEPLDGVDRYLYGTSDIANNAPAEGDPKHRFIGHKVAFFALNGAAEGEQTVAVHRLHTFTPADRREYYKLSLKTDDDGYKPEAGRTGPNFHAFASEPAKPYVRQVYEHAAATPTAGTQKYIYDFEAAAHHGWGEGKPIFGAITLQEAEKALAGSLGSQNARRYAIEWVNRYGQDIGKLILGKKKGDVDQTLSQQFHRFFEGMPRVKYKSLGGGIHGGYGVGTAGVEFGSIWHADDFGHVPMRTPLSDYSVEWVTFGGATGLDLGGSADALAFGTWFGDISQIEGACNGVTIAGQYFGGLAITLLWDGTWQGANYGPHPIGVTVVLAAGIEVGAGVFYNASATQFWHRRPNFPEF